MIENEDLTLEKLRISERLKGLETLINAYIELRREEKLAQQETFHRIEKHLEKLDNILIGNTIDGTLGIIGRLTKIEDQLKEQKENGKIAKTALFGIIIKFIWDFFTHTKWN